ncbi:hypothetical protein G7046_g404 [Stylonectria norvegica]|nr:hypothetical protein G7046_g404 [Stylonectria norvegica]
MADETIKYYPYNPSLPVAIIAIVIFSIASFAHSFLLIRARAWFFIPFLLGCLLEVAGYVARAIGAKQTPNWTLAPFAVQILTLLLGPTFFAASIYMILGRFIRSLGADKYSLIRTTWLTKFFLLGDIVSIAAQALGGGMLANANTVAKINLGQNIIIIGLAVQVLFFILFIIVTGLFHLRLRKNPTPLSSLSGATWQKFLMVLYSMSLLILVRSIYRMTEYLMGHNSTLQSKEVYGYIFDALLMAGVTVGFAIFHPSRFLTVPGKSALNGSDSEIQLGGYGVVPGVNEYDSGYGQDQVVSIGHQNFGHRSLTRKARRSGSATQVVVISNMSDFSHSRYRIPSALQYCDADINEFGKLYNGSRSRHNFESRCGEFAAIETVASKVSGWVATKIARLVATARVKRLPIRRVSPNTTSDPPSRTLVTSGKTSTLNNGPPTEPPLLQVPTVEGLHRLHSFTHRPSPQSFTVGTPAEKLLDLRLLHHFLQMSATTPAVQYSWCGWIADQALRHSTTMDALLGFSAFHLRRNSDDRVIKQASYMYMARAIRAHKEMLLGGIGEKNAMGMVATASLIIMHGSVNQQYLNPKNQKVVPIHWFRPFRNIWAVLDLAWPWIQNTPVGLTLLGLPSATEVMLEGSKLTSFDFLLEGLDTEGNLENDTVAAYTLAVNHLSLIHCRPSARPLRFMASISARFTQLLEEKDPRTLAIVGYFFMVLEMRHVIWWVNKAPAQEFSAIMTFLPKDWWPKMAWAIRVFEWSEESPS